MTNRIEMGQSVAFQMSQSLGDSLLAMIVVNNLARNGHRVVVFGDYMYSLRDWFPDFEIHRTPKDDEAFSRWTHDVPIDRRKFFRAGLAELMRPLGAAVKPLENVAHQIGKLEEPRWQPPPARTRSPSWRERSR